MKKLIYILSVLSLLNSCVSKTDYLQFTEFEIKDDSGITGILVDEIGNIKISGELMGTLNKDGTINDKKGEIIAKLSDDGILKDKSGKILIKVDKNGKMDNGSGTLIEWTENGELMKGNEKIGLKIFPNNKNSFQAASIILFLYLSID